MNMVYLSLYLGLFKLLAEPGSYWYRCLIHLLLNLFLISYLSDAFVNGFLKISFSNNLLLVIKKQLLLYIELVPCNHSKFIY